MHSVGSKCLQAPQLDCDGRRSENETKKEEANGREKKERQREGKTGRRRGEGGERNRREGQYSIINFWLRPCILVQKCFVL